jgi:hypothetical protein
MPVQEAFPPNKGPIPPTSALRAPMRSDSNGLDDVGGWILWHFESSPTFSDVMDNSPARPIVGRLGFSAPRPITRQPLLETHTSERFLVGILAPMDAKPFPRNECYWSVVFSAPRPALDPDCKPAISRFPVG